MVKKQIHYYSIKEVNPVLQGTYQGVSYDQKVYRIKVVVTDQKEWYSHSWKNSWK